MYVVQSAKARDTRRIVAVKAPHEALVRLEFFKGNVSLAPHGQVKDMRPQHFTAWASGPAPSDEPLSSRDK
ncbi:hypothetical protein P4O66_003798 [Electrophorus voltai]|uniref:Uncharacterized protein n=1 Tax=Electrophorus voltai TaxID=2609070 RepID=A0AAD9E6G7_9TELE|nr:hypothetical protein P4O66_003798 [Electrophorus voltai]